MNPVEYAAAVARGSGPSGEPADHSGAWDGRQVVSDAGPGL